MRKLLRGRRLAAVLLTIAGAIAVPLLLTTGGGGAAPGHAHSNQTEGDESVQVARAIQDFTDQRAAPDASPNAAAYAAAATAAKTVASTRGSWTEAGPYGYNSDDPNYADPVYSNSGGGAGYVSGRITALAALSDGRTVFAGAAGGGVWKSTDGGFHWKPTFDTQDALSIGALAVDEAGKSTTVYAGTGEANTNSDAYAGIGVLKSTDGASTWSKVGGTELNGATVYRLTVDKADHRVYAATSHGLYRLLPGATSWQLVLGTGSSSVSNMVTDVVVRPGTGGASGDVLAAIGWRGGAATNGLYESKSGADPGSFVRLAPQGYVSANNSGRVSLAWSTDASRLYALVESPNDTFHYGNTNLQGIYVSKNGPQGPFNNTATSSVLMNSGSAMKPVEMGGNGYTPGAQAWYDQVIAVDPNDASHVYVGLEEVFETTDGGGKWTTVAPYWAFPFACFSRNPFPGTCPVDPHSDQHAMAMSNGILWIGNDGGVYSKAMSDHTWGGWNNLNQTLGTLQFYYAGGGKDPRDGSFTMYGGLQDNGTAKVDGSFSASPFGGDGGDVLVDPANADNIATEYVDLIMAKSRDGGHTWTDLDPHDPNPRFIAPFGADSVDPSFWVAGGEYVYTSSKGFDTTSWTIAFDQGVGHATTALDSAKHTIYAAWCGPCNPSGVTTGTNFRSGIATNYGGAWHQLTPPLPNRFPSAVTVDPANPAHAYLTYSGYSRRWAIGPLDPGVGHVFETSDGGSSWTDISGDLIDAPTNDVVVSGTHLVVANDFGVFVSGLHGGTWKRLGAGLPNVIVDDLNVTNGTLIAATHGRGLWTLPVSAIG